MSDARTAARGGLYSGRPLDRGERVLVALTIGLAAALATFVIFAMHPEFHAKDFTYVWRAGRALLAGQDPYVVIRPSGPYPFEAQYMYPLTAAVASTPFALLPAPIGGALFVGLGAGALAFLLGREGMGRMWLFASAPFAMAVSLGQWSPLLVAAALATPLSWLLTCKPTLGAALFLYRPSWRVVAICVAFGLLALVLQPRWPFEWLEAAGKVRRHPAPALNPVGALALLALIRWRKPEARLVAAMALVPQNPYLYDQLPLWLAARDGRSTLALTALSWVAFAITHAVCRDPYFCGPEAEWPVMLLLYLPATLLVLLDADGRAAVARWWQRRRTA